MSSSSITNQIEWFDAVAARWYDAIYDACGSFGRAQDGLGETALMKAARADDLVLAQILAPVEAGMLNFQGRTALMIGAVEDSANVCELLVAISAERDHVLDFGEDALIVAATAGALKAAKVIFPHRTGHVDAKGRSALVYAAAYGRFNVLNFLLEARPPETTELQLALVAAASDQHGACVEALSTYLRDGRQAFLDTLPELQYQRTLPVYYGPDDVPREVEPQAYAPTLTEEGIVYEDILPPTSDPVPVDEPLALDDIAIVTRSLSKSSQDPKPGPRSMSRSRSGSRKKNMKDGASALEFTYIPEVEMEPPAPTRSRTTLATRTQRMGVKPRKEKKEKVKPPPKAQSRSRSRSRSRPQSGSVELCRRSGTPALEGDDDSFAPYYSFNASVDTSLKSSSARSRRKRIRDGTSSGGDLKATYLGSLEAEPPEGTRYISDELWDYLPEVQARDDFLPRHIQPVDILLTEPPLLEDDGTWTSLMTALQNRNGEEVTQKLNNQVQWRTETGWTALMVAALVGNTQVATALAGTSLAKSQTCTGWTALMYAAYQGHADIVRVLLSQEAGMTAAYGWTALMLALVSPVRGAQACAVTLASHEAGRQNQQGVTALMLAAYRGLDTVIPCLIDKELGRTDVAMRSALMYAALGNHPGCARLLAESEARLRDPEGRTALMMAAQLGYREVVDLLSRYESGCRANLGRTALMFAARNGQVEVIDDLIGEATLVDKEGWSAMMMAALDNQVAVIELLRRREAGLRTRRGFSALMIAARYGYLESVQALAEAEAGLQTLSGSFALFSAVLHGNLEVVRVLAPYERNLKTKRGEGALTANSRNPSGLAAKILRILRADAQANSRDRRPEKERG
ncbi:Ankyrin repeat protein 1 [Giardia muris]|uniref:Ankyrin repeat protein 1 n=1 Tax=Giardia muris TaxID=5742 RepID=A0A4Z1SLR2_GIAMU|nr:Ankyrin repeat protein 1 [Giardia muris]|eukprot:TNJ26606.1 Ankyrin repeat protein 1 [Giardia muris]